MVPGACGERKAGGFGPEQGRLFDVLDREHDNLRAALDWAEREPDHELLLRLTSSLGYFWALRGHVEETRVRLARALAAPLPPGSEDLRTSILCYAADDARLAGRVKLAEELITEAVELARRGGDDALIGRALSMSGVIAGEFGDIARGEQLQSVALERFRACEDEWGEMAVFTRLTDLALKGDDLIRAQRVATDSLAIAEAVGEQSGIGVARTNLAIIGVERHRPDEAKTHAIEAIRHFTTVGEQEGTSYALELLAAAVGDAQPREAARLLGLAAVLREAVDTVRGSPEQSLLERTLEGVRGRLGPNEFGSVFDSVRDLDPAAAMAEAKRIPRALH
jgi:hypothetical protein